MVIEFFHDDLHTAPPPSTSAAAATVQRYPGKREETKAKSLTITTTTLSGTPSTKRVLHWITVIIQFIIIQSVIMARRWRGGGVHNIEKGIHQDSATHSGKGRMA